MYDDDDNESRNQAMSFIVGFVVAFLIGLPIIFYTLFVR